MSLKQSVKRGAELTPRGSKHPTKVLKVDEEDCSICLIKLSPLCTLMECKHSFCVTCITQWSAAQYKNMQAALLCPLCKGEYLSASVPGQPQPLFFAPVFPFQFLYHALQTVNKANVLRLSSEQVLSAAHGGVILVPQADQPYALRASTWLPEMTNMQVTAENCEYRRMLYRDGTAASLSECHHLPTRYADLYLDF